MSTRDRFRAAIRRVDATRDRKRERRLRARVPGPQPGYACRRRCRRLSDAGSIPAASTNLTAAPPAGNAGSSDRHRCAKRNESAHFRRSKSARTAWNADLRSAPPAGGGRKRVASICGERRRAREDAGLQAGTAADRRGAKRVLLVTAVASLTVSSSSSVESSTPGANPWGGHDLDLGGYRVVRPAEARARAYETGSSRAREATCSPQSAAPRPRLSGRRRRAPARLPAALAESEARRRLAGDPGALRLPGARTPTVPWARGRGENANPSNRVCRRCKIS